MTDTTLSAAAKRPLGIAVSESARVHDVGAELVVQHRRAFRERCLWIDHCRLRAITHLDEIERVLCDVAVFGHDDRDRLAEIARAPDRAGVVAELARDQVADRLRHRGDIGAGEHADHARQLLGLARCRC